MLPPHENESEVLRDPPIPRVWLEEGTVGWLGDADSVDHGRDDASGVTLLKITLAVGCEPGRPAADDGGANGHRIVARVSGPSWAVPARGTRVLIAFPGGDPSRGVLLAEIGPSPASGFGRNKMTFGDPEKHVKIVGKSVSILSLEKNDDGSVAHSHCVSVSTEGGVQATSDGSGLFSKDGEVSLRSLVDGDLKTAVLLTPTELTAMDRTSGTATVTLTGGNVTLVGNFVSVIPITAMKIGQTASPATPFLLGPSGFAGVPSTFIWGAVAP